MAQKLAALKTPLILRDMASPIMCWRAAEQMHKRERAWPQQWDGSHWSAPLTSMAEKGGREKSLATHSSKLRPKQFMSDQM